MVMEVRIPRQLGLRAKRLFKTDRQAAKETSANFANLSGINPSRSLCRHHAYCLAYLSRLDPPELVAELDQCGLHHYQTPQAFEKEV